MKFDNRVVNWENNTAMYDGAVMAANLLSSVNVSGGSYIGNNASPKGRGAIAITSGAVVNFDR